MEQNKKMVAGFISALLILLILIPLGMKMTEKKKEISNSNPTKNREIEIKDTCEEGSVFPDAIEKYYEDEKYICTFSQIKSGCYVVTVDGKDYSLKDALNNQVITIEEGMEHGLYCEKKSTGIEENPESNTNSNIESNTNTNSTSNSNTNTNANKPSTSNSNVISNKNTNINSSTNVASNSNVSSTKKIKVVNKCSGNVTQALDYFYEDNQYRYYFTSGVSGCTYVNVNGKEYTLRNALNQKIVTMKELEEVGFKCLKESKNLVEK